MQIPLHDSLTRSGKLIARVDFDVTSASDATPEGRPLSLAKFVKNAVPSSIMRKIVAKNVHEFSAKIGHSLDYQITWRE